MTMRERTEPTHVLRIEIPLDLSQGFVDRDYQRVSDLDCEWIKVIPHEDGIAEVFLANGDEWPRDYS